MTAYYNENDPFAAAWLRELITAGLIAPGEVDERSIEEVKPDDLRGFTQCHFFAGIGVWSYALRSAGWSDDLAVWTGSCPCQGFSASGQRGGFSDKRHLWPAWFRLISECRPVTVFGEQVASKDGLAWLDVVSADMEAAGYAIGATDLCAASFGAPHIRQRLYFVAHAEREQLRANGPRSVESPPRGMQEANGQRERVWHDVGERGAFGNLAHAAGNGHERDGRTRRRRGGSENGGELGDANNTRPQRQFELTGASGSELLVGATSFTNGFWANAEWLYCRDEKWRPVEPGTFPLVTGAPNRVGRLRGYGNAINAEVAQAFIEAYMSLVENTPD